MNQTERYAERLLWSNLIREPAMMAAIQALGLPPGSSGLDAGCGIGLHTVRLAEAVGSAGYVVGVDVMPEFLALGETRAEQDGLADRVMFQEGDIQQLPFEDDSFDWVWCADTFHPDPTASDPYAVLQEFKRVLKPGGVLALVYWSSQRLLPGYAALEARLDTAFAVGAPYTNGDDQPDFHLLRGLGWLQAAGFENRTVQTFVADVYAPLSDDLRRGLTVTFEMLWGWLRDSLYPADWALFQRLCLDASAPEYLLNRADYYGLVTYSVFRGEKVG